MRTYRFSAVAQGGEETELCSYPIGLDPYRAGCNNNCCYCYVRHANQDRGGWHTSDPTSLDLQHFSAICEEVFEKGKVNSYAKSILALRLPLRVGMNTDPFQVVEKERKITYGLLKILREYKYPYTLLTKNSLAADEAYLSVYDPEISYLQVTVTSLSADMSKRIEHNASLPEERLDALRRLRKAGIKVAVRINPLFPLYPDGYYTGDHHGRRADRLDMFSWELVHRICECRPSTVIVGFLRIESEKSHRWFEREANMNLRPFFWKHPSHKYYSRQEIAHYYQECKRICDQHAIPFSICFDCNANYDYFRHMWVNQRDCCNALGQTKYHDKTYRMIV